MKLRRKIFYISSLFLLIFSFLHLEKVNISLAVGTWTEQTNSGQRDWSAVASSADGVKLAATDGNNGYIYTSTDSGVNWTEQTNSGQRLWSDISSSSDGTKLVATDFTGDAGYIYTSTDSGVNWTEQTNSGQRNWSSVASSSDGINLVAVVNNGYIYTSTDSGVNWTEQTNSGQNCWTSVATSSNGVKLAATAMCNGLGVFTSTDSGVNWTEQIASNGHSLKSVASSSDGVNLVVGSEDEYIYTSTDSGVNWTEQTDSGLGNWNDVASSSDGTKLAAGMFGGYIYTSTDGGVNWNAETSAGLRNWKSTTSSSDGTKLAVVALSSNIFTFAPDITAPTVSSFSPVDEATAVGISADLVITFSEIVDVENGNIIIYKSSDDTVFETIDVAGIKVTGTGTNIININPDASFVNSDNYYVQIDATAFDDPSGNSFAGIADETAWNFTTVSAPSGGGGGGGSPQYVCDDELDNDGDGLVDYPIDPGCEDKKDRDEFNVFVPPPIVYICSDGIDNDSDGAVDFPIDTGCASSNDQDESNQIISPPSEDENQPTETCATNSSLCPVLPIETVETCATNSSLCGPATEDDPCLLNPDSCNEGDEVIEEEVIEEEPILFVNTKDEISENNCENPTKITDIILCSFVDSYNFTLDKIEVSLEQVDFIVVSPGGNFIVKAIGIVGIIFGAIFSVLPRLFASPFSFTEIAMLPYRLWSAMLSVFGLKKRVRPWGTVYDSVTKQPLDPVIVSLQNLEGQEVESSITDMDGRYGFFVGPGRYRISPKKTHYDFPSLKLVGETRDELYLDLYFGDVFEISSDGGVITKNVPMDPVGFDWNEFAKRDQKLMKFYSKRDLLLTKFSDLFFSFGFCVSFLAFVSVMNFYNIFIFAMYLVLLFLRETGLKIKNLGSVLDMNGNPLSFSILKIFEAKTNTLIAKKVANKYGQYYCLIQQGTYFVEIDQKLQDASYKTVFKSQNIDAKKGYINEKFKINL